MTSLHNVAALTVVLLVLMPGVAPAAGAHDGLPGTVPAAGATLDDAPDEVVLTFQQRLASYPPTVVVTAPSGARVHVGVATVEGPQVRQPISTGEHGTFTVAYRVVAADGHPVSGSFTFTAGSPVTSAAALPAADEPAGSAAVPLVVAVSEFVLLAACLVALVVRSRHRARGNRSGTSES